jgi:hypothetical protein
MDKRTVLVVAVSLLLTSFLLQPVATATVSSRSQTTEIIPINVNLTYQIFEKQVTITVQGVARVTAAGDAHFSLTITNSESEDGSPRVITTRSSAAVDVPEFVKYREAVAAFNRGEIDSPVPQVVEQHSTKGVYTGPKYSWYGIEFVAPGDPVYYIDFDHPDNYDTYYPFQWNTNWVINDYPGQSGWLKWVNHVSSGYMQLSVQNANLYWALLGLATAFGFAIWWLVGVVLGMLAGIAFGVWAFLVIVMQSEQYDGWAYTHDNLANHNRLISFGLWRDWGWYLCQW